MILLIQNISDFIAYFIYVVINSITFIDVNGNVGSFIAGGFERKAGEFESCFWHSHGSRVKQQVQYIHNWNAFWTYLVFLVRFQTF